LVAIFHDTLPTDKFQKPRHKLFKIKVVLSDYFCNFAL
jgi:hypothetical protein